MAFTTIHLEAPQISLKEGALEFSRFIKGAGSKQVNCTDCAYIIQTMFNLLGADSKSYKMQPFGYINPTALIGKGTVNNPFYDDPDCTGPALNSNHDAVSPERLPFGFHRFVKHNNKVYDACAGPHDGENISTYMTSARDNSDTTLTRTTPNNAQPPNTALPYNEHADWYLDTHHKVILDSPLDGNAGEEKPDPKFTLK